MLILLYASLVGACSPASEAPVSKSAPLSWEKQSNRELYVVTIKPREADIPIGEFHEWIIGVKDRDGQPVSSARIAISGGMPDHGHGLPTQPQVTDYLGGGQYRIEGMRFNMAGAWVLVLQLRSAVGQDQVQFDLDLRY